MSAGTMSPPGPGKSSLVSASHVPSHFPSENQSGHWRSTASALATWYCSLFRSKWSDCCFCLCIRSFCCAACAARRAPARVRGVACACALRGGPLSTVGRRPDLGGGGGCGCGGGGGCGCGAGPEVLYARASPSCIALRSSSVCSIRSRDVA